MASATSVTLSTYPVSPLTPCSTMLATSLSLSMLSAKTRFCNREMMTRILSIPLARGHRPDQMGWASTQNLSVTSKEVAKVSFRNWGLSVLSNQHSLHSDLISWRSSTLGTFMLNFDGMVSLIMQLQDTSLEIMMVPYWPAAGGKQLFSYLVSYAEMIGVWLGLQYLLSHTTVRKVCIQGDSMVVLSWLHYLPDKLKHSSFIMDEGYLLLVEILRSSFLFPYLQRRESSCRLDC
ncbi:uncharacterized protein [Elaeis guineensis]|uniref:uncharacterized protein isoform X1 n=1 Tax=Elaeis guineensis var. tenera TaxID=51953 RepID=UPI003C6D7DBF